MQSKDVLAAATELKNYWNPREREFKAQYELIALKDKLKQADMESFVSNDPRTFYLKAMQLLTSVDITHRVPLEGLETNEIAATTQVEVFLKDTWKRVDRKYRLQGRKPWIKEFTSFLLAFGWYSAICLFDVDKNELIAEVWNPAEVFPEFGAEGLIRVVHRYIQSSRQARSLCRANNWVVPDNISEYTSDRVDTIDYWEMTDDGPANAVVLGTTLVKPLTPLPIRRMPVIVAPVAGLPDRGSIDLGSIDWRAKLGQGIIAPNVPVYHNQNRQATFQQQILRDIATPRYKEKTMGDVIVENPEDLTKRGALFRMGIQEDIEPFEVPPIPIEVQASLFAITNMIQRGSFPWAIYGNIQQEVSGYLNAQITSAAMGTLEPFHDAIQFVLSEIDNIWLEYIAQDIISPGFQIPSGYPVGRDIEVTYDLAIPSDMLQRVALARQVAPGVPLMSQTTVQDKILGIKNPIQEQARIVKDIAMTHPIAMQIALHSAYAEHARYLRDIGEEEEASMYEAASDIIAKQISQMPSTLQPAGQSSPQGAPPSSVLPPEQMLGEEVERP